LRIKNLGVFLEDKVYRYRRQRNAIYELSTKFLGEGDTHLFYMVGIYSTPKFGVHSKIWSWDRVAYARIGEMKRDKKENVVKKRYTARVLRNTIEGDRHPCIKQSGSEETFLLLLGYI